MKIREGAVFRCPFCHSFEYFIPANTFSPVRINCPVCHVNFLHYLNRNECKQTEAFELRAFLPCGTRTEEERQVLADFRETLYWMGVLTRTVGVEPDLQASSQREALVLAYKEIQKADFIIAIELRRYHVNGYLPSIWTLGIEPVLSFIQGKPIYVFSERGVRLEGPLSEVALKVIEFDRNLLNYEPERRRIEQWLQTIKNWEIRRKQQRIRGTIILIAGLLGGIIGFIVGNKIGEALAT